MTRILISLFFLTLSCSVLIAGDTITLEEAKALAAKSKKPLLLDFFTEW